MEAEVARTTASPCREVAVEEATTMAAGATILEAMMATWDLKVHTCKTLAAETQDHAWAEVEATAMEVSLQQEVLLTPEVVVATTWMTAVTKMTWVMQELVHQEDAQEGTTTSPSETEADPKRRTKETP